MKTTLLMLLALFSLQFADIPLANTPSWTSSDSDVSTGGALYDMTMDGWIDYCTGNGNDIEANTNAIYVNQNGTLETAASWRSDDTGYFSHIYIGDVDNDGLPDMAVSYLGLGANQGPTRIYRNNGSGLDPSAWWTSADQYNSFDCAFGDVDLDGDLDLAVAAGDAYNNILAPVRVYRNNNGTVETTPYWTSADSTPSDACRWVDLDNDGFLDLVVGYRRKLAVFKNTGGVLEDSASWSTTEPGWILRIAIADYDNDGFRDVAVACNGQQGSDQSRIEVYRNEAGVLQTPPAFVMLTTTNYSSCVAWGDANHDGWLDLAAGGWWEPVVVFENNSGTISTVPTWSWYGGSLVCEALMWGDVRNLSLDTLTDLRDGDGSRKLFYFDHYPAQVFQGISIGGAPLSWSDFCYDPVVGWVGLKNAPPVGTDNVEIKYIYSQHPDLAVTNWEDSYGNHLFHNTAAGIDEASFGEPPVHRLTVFPNPFRDKTTIKYALSTMHYAENNVPTAYSVVPTIHIYDATGRMIKHLVLSTAYSLLPTSIVWDGSDENGQRLPTGTYFLRITDGSVLNAKIVLIR